MNLANELEWEENMIDHGIERYKQEIYEAKYRNTKNGRVPAMDESATSYGASLIREAFDEFEGLIQAAIDEALNKKGVTNTSIMYLASMNIRETAFIAAKCIIDTITVPMHVAMLANRIATRLEDQARMLRFSEDYRWYYEALCNDMDARGIRNYRRKRTVLNHCHKRVLQRDSQIAWEPWPIADTTALGGDLIKMFAAATGFISIEPIRKGNKLYNTVEPTQAALALIDANMSACQYLTPNFMPMLIKPKPWTSFNDGGYWHEQMRIRKPLVRQRIAVSRWAQEALIAKADMPQVYEAVNAAQDVAWCVNKGVLEQAMAEVKAKGIGCPKALNAPEPINPYPYPDQEDMDDAQYAALCKGLRENRTPDEMEEIKLYSKAMTQWHTNNASSRGKMMDAYQAVKVANLLKDKERFYYVHSLCFRGRLYPCGKYLTPQGNGIAKGLLQFADAVSLGQYGYWHLCIHVAGVYGEDKVPLENRIAWVHAHSRQIMDTWTDPASTREFWGEADKPYMFLATCLELAQIWMTHGKKVLTIVSKEGCKGYAADFKSQIPCAQDGSCNGIQHFSAMLADPVGAKATNMLPSDEVQDIYGQTAALTEKLIKADMAAGVILAPKDTRKAITADEIYYLEMYLNVLKIDRKVCKRSTMTIPYGGTRQAVGRFVQDDLEERIEKLNIDWSADQVTAASRIMASYVWKALIEVVVAARKAMKFLRAIVAANNKLNLPLQWTSPLGFPCYQDKRDMRSKEVSTKLSGSMRIWYTEATDNIHKAEMSNGFAPNFVHSMDATHLMMTVNAAMENGIDQFALVHDSLGVPAGQVDGFHKIIREQFIKLYETDRLYALLMEQKAKHPEIANLYPGLETVEPGEFKVNEVADADFFFR